MSGSGVQNRVIIVTGSGSGIGRGLVTHLGRAGARVVVAEREPDLTESAVKELEAEGITCLGVVCDVLEQTSIQNMVDATLRQFGQVDGLVNNAMTIRHGPVAELTEADVDVCFTSGFKGSLWAMQAVYPHMKRAGWGRVVNVASAVGVVGFKGMAAYGSTKEAIRSLTRSAAREWAADGIVVNCYCPVSMGHRNRQWWRPETTAGDSALELSLRILSSLSPASRDGDAESDIGPVVEFLCSDDCRYLTGQTLMLDGGAFAFA
jgi:NAD(P)-dependent dehydrogenase (short-subunit alcohol dehydrogenase family)